MGVMTCAPGHRLSGQLAPGLIQLGDAERQVLIVGGQPIVETGPLANFAGIHSTRPSSLMCTVYSTHVQFARNYIYITHTFQTRAPRIFEMPKKRRMPGVGWESKAGNCQLLG